MPDLDRIKSTINQLINQDEGTGTWGIIIEDIKSGQRLEWNGEEPFYAASVIKVPIMVSAFSSAWEGKFSIEDKIVLTREMQVGGAGVLQHLSPGLEISIRDLITLMIIQSDNTATNMVIDIVGVERIRKTMKELGMGNSHFYNKLMIMPAQVAGYNTITASDIASCYCSIAMGKAVSYQSSLEMIDILKHQQVRNGLPSLLPYTSSPVIGQLPRWELAHKTGTLENIQHDAGILYLGDDSIIIVALSKGYGYTKANEVLGKLARCVYDLYI